MTQRACKRFGLTLANCELDKLHVYYSLTDLCERILISRECHNKCEQISTASDTYHFHAYLETTDKYTITLLRDIIATNLDSDTYNGSIHLDTLKNHSKWIKYITKEDTTPLWNNIDTSLFHQAFKIHQYIASTNNSQSLLRQLPQYYKFLEEKRREHEECRAETQYKLSYIHPNINDACTWVEQFNSWWINSDSHALYLFGDTGVGKTAVVNRALFQLNPGTVVRLPCGETAYEFSQLTHSTRVVYADDANSSYLHTHRQTLLQLTQHGPLTFNPKFGKITTIWFTGKVIINSNFDFTGDEALQRRFTIIQASTKAILP